MRFVPMGCRRSSIASAGEGLMSKNAQGASAEAAAPAKQVSQAGASRPRPSAAGGEAGQVGNQAMLRRLRAARAGRQQVSRRGDAEEVAADSLAAELMEGTAGISSKGASAAAGAGDGEPLPPDLRSAWELRTGRGSLQRSIAHRCQGV